MLQFTGMVNCKRDGCKITACYGMKGGKAQFCATHKTAEMVNVKAKRCQHVECNILNPNFDIKGGKGRYCVSHKTAEMVDVKNKRCIYPGCDSRPTFDIKGGKGRYCGTHKTAEMVDVKNKRCEHPGCDSQPTFDIKGGKGRYCVSHKTAEMVDVKNKRCEHPGCDSITPSFDIQGGKGRYCAIHKTAEMVNVKAKRCVHPGCDSQPSFDIKGGKGRYCVTHKTAEMIDVKHKHCEHPGCDSQPIFDIKGGKGRYCATHKTAEMVDVKNKRCEHPECNTHVSYGLPGQFPSHCAQHRKPGMMLKPRAKCKDCKNLAIYGINRIPKHCEMHKTEDDENLLERPCNSCGLLYILDKAGYCEICHPESFAVARLAKQTALMDYLDAHGLKGESTDKIVEGGICGKERPDRIYDFGDKIIILECDEFQHQDRACACEQTRMVNIAQSFGGIPVYFIRWNPDDYCPENERKKPEELAKRYKLCADVLRDIQSGKHELPYAFVSALYLYYDGWSSLQEESWNVLLKYEDDPSRISHV